MSTTSGYNMFRLEAPCGHLQITNDEESQEEALEIANPVGWMRAMANHQQQAELDLRQLLDLCGNTMDRTDRRIRKIEAAYNRLSQGAQYVYEQLEAKELISGDWVRNELMVVANAYQAFTRQVWEAIIDRTTTEEVQRMHQTTQITRMHDAVAFLSEVNLARNTHLVEFQGNVEKWAADRQQKVEAHERQGNEDRRRMTDLERQLANARDELTRVATTVTLPATPPEPTRPRHPAAREPSESAPTRLTLGSLLLGGTARRRRPPALPALPTQGGSGGSLPPPRPPRRPAPPSPSLAPSEGDDDLYKQNLPAGRPPPGSAEPTTGQLATMLRPEEIARLVGAGIAAARLPPRQAEPQIRTSRLKMENPEKFDGKSSANFNQWWESVTMYLGFYPETVDRQKIAWIGTLLTDTTLVWHLQRYWELGENDTWVNYSAVIQTEYPNEREAADAQLKLGQLKYQGSIRTYLTEFRALNNFARATGEALREKVDLAMPDAILDMRFAHYLGDFADDEGFLQATHQAGLQVERKKALRAAREYTKHPTGTIAKKEEAKKDGQGKENPGNPRNGKETDGEPRTERRSNLESEYGKTGRWASETAAFEGVPTAEKREYAATRGCHRCGRPGHRAAKCFANTTAKRHQPSCSAMEGSSRNEVGSRNRGRGVAGSRAQGSKNSGPGRYGPRATVGRRGGFLKGAPAWPTGESRRVISGAGQKRKNEGEGGAPAKKPKGGPRPVIWMVLTIGTQDYRVRILLDTGCSIPLLNRKTAGKLGVELEKHDPPLPIENFTGQTVEGAGQYYTKPLFLRHRRHVTRERFEVSPMEEGIDIFLPFWWIAKHPPQGAWQDAEIRFNSAECL